MPPKLPVSHKNRHLVCQEEVDGPLRVTIDDATTNGWCTIDTISAREAVLRHLRFAALDMPSPVYIASPSQPN